MKIVINGVERDATPAEEAEILAAQAALSHPSIVFRPIEPADFWFAVYDLFGIKDTDVLAQVEDPEERYLATNALSRRKTYLRDNETFIQLAALNGYTDAEQVDDLWLYIQAHYSS